ncbi:MAG TPA: TetR/AcrR family transcriptional regulator [Acidimicrobiales bacterium]|nr:TetR/AcrR family transcriptional regulator [Acidimicrobiales bacterium]
MRAPAGEAGEAGDGPVAAPGPTGGAPSRSRELRKQGRETLRRLCEAAIVVLDERGYNAARVDDIVRQAKTSHGTFYLYFSNKEDLFQTLVSGVTEDMRELADDLPAVGPTKAGYDELRVWVARFYDLYSHYHPVIRAWTELNASNTDMARRGAFVLRRFIDQLVLRVRETDPRANPETAALAMVAMVERATFYAIVGLVRVDRDELVDNLASILHVGLFGGVRRRR